MSYNIHAATRHRYSKYKKGYGGRTGREEKDYWLELTHTCDRLHIEYMRDVIRQT